MPQIALAHQPDLAHHVAQGRAWLNASDGGNNTAALSYAAFELRLAIERIAIHYWAVLLQRRPEEKEMRSIDSFKQVERRIYDLGGHQREIDMHFEFMRVILRALKIDISLKTPHIAFLSSSWHACSELCHIAWPLSCSVHEVRTSAFASLGAIAERLAEQIQNLGWPTIQDEGFAKLRDGYVNGNVSEGEVESWLTKNGLWAQVEYPDGRPSKPVGQPVSQKDPTIE